MACGYGFSETRIGGSLYEVDRRIMTKNSLGNNAEKVGWGSAVPEDTMADFGGLLEALGGEIKEIEKQDKEDTKEEIRKQQQKIAENKDAFASLPSQNADSVKLHSAIVEGFKNRMTTTDLKKRFLMRKQKRRQKRKAKRAEQISDKMGEKRNRAMKKKKRRNRIKGMY